MTPEQVLAQAVITRAILDARFKPERIKSSQQWAYKREQLIEARDSAREFLAGGPDLAFWCEMAQLPYERVKRSIDRQVQW